jgi:hypothetical protein
MVSTSLNFDCEYYRISFPDISDLIACARATYLLLADAHRPGC